MSNLNPTAPSQPTLSQAYTTPGNAATKSPSEATQTSATAASNATSRSTDQRIPPTQSADSSSATPSALGHGIHGAPPGEEAKGLTDEDVGRHRENDGEQMAAPGEGKVADAVAGRGEFGSGRGGEQPDMAADLERKKAEQAEAREAVKAEKSAGAAVGGAKGQQGGPANPVGKGNYPNSDGY